MCSIFFFFKQKTAYEMRISDWSSDVCSSVLLSRRAELRSNALGGVVHQQVRAVRPEGRSAAFGILAAALGEAVAQAVLRSQRRALPQPGLYSAVERQLGLEIGRAHV